MKKEQLRQIYLEKMESLSRGELDDKSQNIAAFLFSDFKIKETKAIHIFISIARNNEVNTFLVINKLLKDFPEIKIGVPKSDFKKLAITSYEYTIDSKLKVNKLGIPEPTAGTIIQPEDFQIILVPLLCFDKNGMRVGYGKGFYDRYLANAKNAIKIGLSLFEPIDSIGDTDNFDIALDYCITPEKVFSFTK